MGSALPLPGTVPFEEYAPRFLHIRTKSAKIIPFVPNPPQLRLLGVIREARDEGRPVRIIVLKARQLGFSTLSLGLMYEATTGNEGTHALMAADDDENGVDLFERVRLMHDLAPRRPLTRYSNRRELDFSNPDRRKAGEDPGLLSKITVGTAGKINLGRSKTLRYLHLSEVAFWKDADRVLVSLEQALPDDPGTVEIIESTANGVGGEFYERWKRASNPDTRGDWRAVFFPWHEQEEYRRAGLMAPIPDCIVDVAAFIREENELRSLYSLDDEQISWRRWAIVNKCGNNLDKFKQEYPSNPDEAFLMSGRPVFNQQLLAYRKRELDAEDARRKAEGRKPRFIRGDLAGTLAAPRVVPKVDGDLWVFRLPQKGHDYMIGGDTAEGVTKGNDPDACAAQVIDRITGEQVAVWHGHITPSGFARFLIMLGYLYNRAVLVPEVNNHGHSVVAFLQDERYPRIHIRRDFDTIAHEWLDRPGWATTTKTRALIVDSLIAMTNDRDITINHTPTLEQMMTFVHNKKTGKPEADVACHDDLVMALGIVTALLKFAEAVPARSSAFNPDSKLDAISAAASRDLRKLVDSLRRRQREEDAA